MGISDFEFKVRGLLEEKIVKYRNSIPRKQVVELTEKIIQTYNALHEADPVKHGEWIPIEYDGFADGYAIWELWECSECHEEHSGTEDTLPPYCPFCGAKMDAEDFNNADRIRSLTDIELAERLQEFECPPTGLDACAETCTKCWLKWLQQTVDAIALENLRAKTRIELEENENE